MKHRIQYNYIRTPSLTTCPPEEDKAEQFHLPDTDLTRILDRMRAGNIQRKPVVYGEQDFTEELTAAHLADLKLREQFQQLPDDIKRQYPDWRDLAKGLLRGEVKFEPVKPETVEAPAPSAVPPAPAPQDASPAAPAATSTPGAAPQKA